MAGLTFCRYRSGAVRRGKIVALALSLAAAQAFAQDAGVSVDPARRAAADARFQEALSAFGRAEYPAAAEGFRAAYELVPHPFALYNMGRAYQEAGEVARAVEAYDRYLRESPDAPDAAEVRRRHEDLSRRPVEVFISSEPSGATIRIDGEDRALAEGTPVALRLAPGPHALAVEHAGRRPAALTVVVLPGVALARNVVLEPDAAPPPPPPPSPPPPPPPGVYARVMQRRTGRLLSGRFSLLGGFAWPRDRLNFALGADATLFVGRSFAVQGHFLRLEADGTPLVLVGELGWVFVVDDLDLGAFINLGALFSCEASCRDAATDSASAVLLGGLTLRADLMLLPHVGIGLFGRFHWRNLEVTSSEALLSSLGFSISITL